VSSDRCRTEPAANAGISRETLPVLGVKVDAVGWDAAVDRIIAWSHEAVGRTIYLCNVHVAVSATRSPRLAAALGESDLVLPDGAPVAWMQRRLGASSQQRIDGPNLMERLCAAAERDGIPIFLLGGSPPALAALVLELAGRLPRLVIAGTWSPPFREFTPEDNRGMIDEINTSGARLVFVGLGCPKQELWMAHHKADVHAVMLGVGAAFDFHAKLKPRAPRWMQNSGLEWLHRLCSEPRRLWTRYLSTNSYFLIAAAAQLAGWGVYREIPRQPSVERRPIVGDG